MATPSLPSPPPFSPLSPSPLGQGNGQAPDLNALLGGIQAPGQAPNPLQQNGPQQLPPPPPAAGVGGNFQQFA